MPHSTGHPQTADARAPLPREPTHSRMFLKVCGNMSQTEASMRRIDLIRPRGGSKTCSEPWQGGRLSQGRAALVMLALSLTCWALVIVLGLALWSALL